jgi:hypothetical protein
MAKTRHKFKKITALVAVGDLSVFVAANFAPMSVLRASSLAEVAWWHAGWLAAAEFLL